MKIRSSVVICVALAVGMSGCGKPEVNPDPTPNDVEKKAPLSENLPAGSSPKSESESGSNRSKAEGAKDEHGEVKTLEGAVAEFSSRPGRDGTAAAGAEPTNASASRPMVGEETVVADPEEAGDIGAESEDKPADPRVRAKQRKELQVLVGLGKGFRVWSLDGDGEYPPQIDHPEFVELLGKPELFKFKNAETGEVARPWYFKGLNAESRANRILLASPWVYSGKRAVTYCDSSGELVAEELFQKQVAESLENEDVELVK